MNIHDIVNFLEPINSITRKLIPLFILINFLILCFLIYINWKYFKEVLKKIKSKTWILLGLIFVAALIIRIYIPPHQHVMYIDEQWYMKAAKDMILTGSQQNYPKYIGWPFILSIFFAFFGINNYIAIYATIFLGALTIFSVFLMVNIITGKQDVSVFAAFIFSLLPVHIRWSATAETNVLALLFVTLSVFFCYVYYKYEKISLFWLSLTSLAFVCQFRPENCILPILFFMGCYIYIPQFHKKIKRGHILSIICFICILIPSTIEEFRFFTDIFLGYKRIIVTDLVYPKNIIGKLFYDSFYYGRYIFNFQFQPACFFLLLIGGMLYAVKSKQRDFWFLLTWLILLWLFFFILPFKYIGGDASIAKKSRFIMMFYPITIIFFAYGYILIKNVLTILLKSFFFNKIVNIAFILLIIICFIPYTMSSSSLLYDTAKMLETKIPEQAKKQIPLNCMVIMHMPEVLTSTTNIQVVPLDNFLDNINYQKEILNNSCVLYFEHLPCYDWVWGKEVFQKQCDQIKMDFHMEPFRSYQYLDKKYIFYKINNS